MKPGKISLPTLVLSFAIVGLMADTLPVPGLKAGIVAQTSTWMINTIQAPARANAPLP
uniref:Uncharacterized protein n=1 Tax=Cyanothece sp. (strain PCC 7425 / ATCC 29141) TaxID=395961 RepID=B8HWQ8_CYAP4